MILRLLLTLTSAAALAASEWPQWRGPLFNGATPETNLPPRLTRQDHLRWSAPLPGRSGATPVTWLDSVFVTSPDPDKNLLLFSVETETGRLRWQRLLGLGDRTVGKNNLASPSPVTDGRVVIALVGTGDLAAFDFDGRERWRRKLRDDFGAFAHMFLYGASPLLFEGRLYVPILQRNPPTYAYSLDLKPERQSWLLCLDPADGRILWQHERKTDAREEAMEAYTTPIPFPGPSGTQLILAGADCVTAHDPASGHERWRYDGLNETRNPGGRIVPSVVVAPGLVFACGPKREKLVALRPTGTGLLAPTQVAWQTNQFIPDVPTPLLYQGKLFVLDGDRQVLNCYQPETGAVLWQGRLGVREIFYASPTGADGRLYCLGENGTLVVLSAGDRFEVLSSTAFGEGPCMASVAIARGRLYLRTAENLHCFAAPPRTP